MAVSEPEAQALANRDLALEARGERGFRLWQPCRALVGRECSIYADRPAGCRAYNCLLATALGEGELGLEEALAIVDEAHTRLRELREKLASSSEGSPVPAIRRSLAGDGPALSEEATTSWSAARDHLRRHFTGRHGMS